LKIKVLDNKDDWVEIELIDGKSGWIPNSSLRII
ncbi:MAG: ion channel protein, partial [Prolixibacteraceae bacterium]|nr:ion channel protein [Prolixibacteraceae bacterium]